MLLKSNILVNQVSQGAEPGAQVQIPTPFTGCVSLNESLKHPEPHFLIRKMERITITTS